MKLSTHFDDAAEDAAGRHALIAGAEFAQHGLVFFCFFCWGRISRNKRRRRKGPSSKNMGSPLCAEPAPPAAWAIRIGDQ